MTIAMIPATQPSLFEPDSSSASSAIGGAVDAAGWLLPA
jgi:hypothetical protein